MTKKIIIWTAVAFILVMMLWLIFKSDDRKPDASVTSNQTQPIPRNTLTPQWKVDPQPSSISPSYTGSQTVPKENPNPTDEEWLAAGIDPSKVEKPLPKGQRTIWSIAQAIRSHRSEFGSYPPGDTPKNIADSLLGKNPKQMIFLESSSKHGFTNAQGELVDPWDTLYQFTFTDDQFEIRSAGPNRQFGDQDDEVYPETKKPSSP